MSELVVNKTRHLIGVLKANFQCGTMIGYSSCYVNDAL